MLVDTSVWIDYLNGHDSLQAESLAKAIVEGLPIVLSGVVLTEILLGLPSAEANRIETLLEAFDLAPALDRGDYIAAAGIYRTCRNKGKTIRSVIDCLIAQTCLKNGYPLLAKDRDFEYIAQCFSLKFCV